MENPVFRQLEQAAAALLLGGGLGLLYDVFRAPRRRLGFAALWDLLFWLCALAMLFLQAQAGGDGVRLYALLAAALGAGLYMRALSPPVLGCLELLCGLPGRALRGLKRFGKKFAEICKKHFPKSVRWFKIRKMGSADPEDPDVPREGGAV